MSQPAMSYLRTHGPAGDAGTLLGWGLGIVSIGVVLVITLLLLVAVQRRRMRGRSDPAALAVDRDEGGTSWLYVGVGVSTLVLIACTVWTLFTMAALAMPHTDLTVQVTGAQWWWSVRYPNTDSQRIFTTANEIHIPVGRPVRFELQSTDVIHSFWIPQLGGKMDVVPGQTNVMWLQADEPGVYRGQCGEYCGAQHAHMAMIVVAEPAHDYLHWTRAQSQAAQAPPVAAQHGEQVFLANCAACHAVRGRNAGGILGPDLTHLMSRHTLAAGTLPNTPGNLAAWIADAQAIKPGSRMPTLQLSGPDLNAVVGYLQTLD